MRKLDNKKLNEIGKRLVKANTLSTHDVDSIVANPALFDSVRMRIALENAGPKIQRSLISPRIAAFASLVLIGGLAFAFVALRSEQPGVVAVRPVPAPLKTTDVKQFRQSDTMVETELPPVDTRIRPERISNKPNVRPARSRQPVAQQARYEGDFYALSYAGDPSETERGGRIVRVDIPRSTLFAMGVNIPLENEAETVKADLLVGNDGVTRAIRVVR